MTKTELIAGPSCLADAADDEPVFLLRSTDEKSPRLVRKWAEEYRKEKGGLAKMTPAQRNKYFDAMQVSIDMELWHLKHMAKGYC